MPSWTRRWTLAAMRFYVRDPLKKDSEAKPEGLYISLKSENPEKFRSRHDTDGRDESFAEGGNYYQIKYLKSLEVDITKGLPHLVPIAGDELYDDIKKLMNTAFEMGREYERGERTK